MTTVAPPPPFAPPPSHLANFALLERQPAELAGEGLGDCVGGRDDICAVVDSDRRHGGARRQKPVQPEGEVAATAPHVHDLDLGAAQALEARPQHLEEAIDLFPPAEASA